MKSSQKDVEKMKRAYDRFIRLAAKVAVSRSHAAILLGANSAYNQFVKELR